jgi:hypothetical protein
MKPSMLPMLRSSLAAAAFFVVAGCNLDIQNPNAPDAKRAFNDPAGLEQLLGGAFRTWVETRGDYFGAMPMTAMADNYTASWNNAAIRFYTSEGVECAQRCGWTNSATAPEAAGGPTVESQWYGYYTVLSAANDVLRAINDGLCFDANCATDNTVTSRNKAIAKMLQGMALAGIALIYDQGFIVDETTDLSNPSALQFSTRAEVRDAAIAKFNEAYTEAGSKTWLTPSAWMGVGAGRSYTQAQIQRVIRTMQAELLALYARDAGENAQTDWNQVATFASQGISSGTPFDFEFYIDPSGSECGLDCVKTWGNSIGTMRVDTRVASALASNHVHPWPQAAGGNPCPTTSNDRRVGDGTWGPADDFNGYATTAATANAGTDYACSGVVIFPAARGQWHQSTLVHIRYSYLAYVGENLPGQDGTGQDPFYTRWMNELLWAEGLLRRATPDLAGAATHINTSRVGRGGLPAVTAATGQAGLIAALQYEQDIEFMGQGPTPFLNRRRADGNCAPFTFGTLTRTCEGSLITGTPRHMPVPAKELDVLVRSVYTFGGSGPSKSLAPGGRKTVDQVWNEYMQKRRAIGRRRS